jgi:hypothetical protein
LPDTANLSPPMATKQPDNYIAYVPLRDPALDHKTAGSRLRMPARPSKTRAPAFPEPEETSTLPSGQKSPAAPGSPASSFKGRRKPSKSIAVASLSQTPNQSPGAKPSTLANPSQASFLRRVRVNK